MAVGAAYPAVIRNANGDETQGITIEFTDENNQPSGDSVPFQPGVDETVTIVNDSGGDPVLDFDDDGAQFNFTGKLDVTGDGELSGDLDVGGNITAAAASTGSHVPAAGQLTSGLGGIASGTLPNTGAWVSGTGKQNPTHGGAPRQVTVFVECVFDGTANAATVAILVSPDNTTFTTVGTPGVSAAINTVGGLTQVVAVTLPAEWYIKLTIATHASVAASIYF